MSTKTTISQNCQSTLDSTGTTRFDITTTIEWLYPGDLPQSEIFVQHVTAANDPKADAFQRIATLYDLTTITSGRARALEKGESTYLARSFTLSYQDLQTANEAKKLVQSRIDRLISDWKIYTSEFTSSSQTLFPLATPGILQARIDAFVAAKQARGAAEIVASDAERALTDVQADAVRKNAALTQATALRMECLQATNSLTQLSGTYNSFWTSVNSALSGLRVYIDGQPAGSVGALEAIRDAFSAALADQAAPGEAVLAALLADALQACALRATELSSAVTAKAIADGAAATAQTDLTVAQAEAAAATAAAEAAYALVKEVCPSYTDPDMD